MNYISTPPLLCPWIINIFTYLLECTVSEEGLICITLFLIFLSLWINILNGHLHVFQRRQTEDRSLGFFSVGKWAGGSAELDRHIDGSASDRPKQILEPYLHAQVAALSLVAMFIIRKDDQGHSCDQ